MCMFSVYKMGNVCRCNPDNRLAGRTKLVDLPFFLSQLIPLLVDLPCPLVDLVITQTSCALAFLLAVGSIVDLPSL